MKEKIIEQLKIGWRMQHLQFEYPSHAKPKIVARHLFAILLSLLLCYVHRYIGFGVLPCIISWNYFFLFDKKKRVYADSYSPQVWEYFGTISASLLFGGILILFITEWPVRIQTDSDLKYTNPGHVGHMMGEYRGIVNDHEAFDIIQKNNIKCGSQSR
jgi:hypothetical protein